MALQSYKWVKGNRIRQFAISLGLVVSVAVLCYLFSGYVGYRTVALILLVTVSFLAMFFHILPVLTAALLSALVWNFFFIPPRFTYTIHSAEDALMFLMYFIIAMLNAILTHKVRQIEKANQSREEKERTLHLYNTMLHSLSHELRTPISTIIAATDNLQNNGDKLRPEDTTALVSHISTAAFRLNQQVENLLNMSRIEAGVIKLRKDWCDIPELIYETVKSIDVTGYEQNICVEVDPAIPIYKLDKGIMWHVLHNLLHNAVLYTPANTTICIRVMSVIDGLKLIIEDDGPGFPESEIGHVFEKFYRIADKQPGGTGLGLSIVKGFVEAHDGWVSLENCVPHGARFTVFIPAASANINEWKDE